MAKKKILWLSQHTLTPRQLAAIEFEFGVREDEIGHDINPFANAREVARRFREGGYDELIFVGPDSVLNHLCLAGLNPWKAIVEEVPRRQAEWINAGQGYRFVSFRKVGRVVIEYIPGEEFSDTKRRGQRFNPTAVESEIHCGDCNLLISDRLGRHHDTIFEGGVRCNDCYRKWKEQGGGQ